MIYDVVGKSNFISRKGTNCYLIYVNYDRDKVIGKATDSIYLKGEWYELIKNIPCKVSIDFDRSGYPVNFSVK